MGQLKAFMPTFYWCTPNHKECVGVGCSKKGQTEYPSTPKIVTTAGLFPLLLIVVAVGNVRLYVPFCGHVFCILGKKLSCIFIIFVYPGSRLAIRFAWLDHSSIINYPNGTGKNSSIWKVARSLKRAYIKNSRIHKLTTYLFISLWNIVKCLKYPLLI